MTYWDYSDGVGPYKATEGATTTLKCKSGYKWSDGTDGASAKSATCKEYLLTVGKWLITGEPKCVGINYSSVFKSLL